MEIATNGMALLMVNRRRVEPIASLGPRQQQWLEARFPGISRNRVVRLADHERAGNA
jgi:hypothetical protein